MTFASPDDPYRDQKKYHMAIIFAYRGETTGGFASALCFKRPRAIVLEHAQWTIRPEAVTCRKCLRLMHESGQPIIRQDADKDVHSQRSNGRVIGI